MTSPPSQHEHGVLRGHVNTVRRRGEVLERPCSESSAVVRAVLTHLEHQGYAGAPRYREHIVREDACIDRVDWIEGDVLVASDYSLAALHELGQLLRDLHDRTASFVLPTGVAWTAAPEPDLPSALVVGHGDLSPANTICRDGLPVAFIDWDLVQPSTRIWDLAHAIWQFMPVADGQPIVPERLRALLTGYGRFDGETSNLAQVVDRRMWRTETGIAELATGGHPAMIALRESGVIDTIRQDRRWLEAHPDQVNAVANDIWSRSPATTRDIH